MNESLQLASEVAHRILVCHYGVHAGENSRLFTDLTEMVRARVDGERLFEKPQQRDSLAHRAVDQAFRTRWPTPI